MQKVSASVPNKASRLMGPGAHRDDWLRGHTR
jgi:hypothetical protein